MYQSLSAQLPASWLATRVGADGAEIERLRRSGELFATRPDGSDEWLYSAWQFGPGGRVPEAVRRAVRLAVDKGLGEEGLLRVLRPPRGPDERRANDRPPLPGRRPNGHLRDSRSFLEKDP